MTIVDGIVLGFESSWMSMMVVSLILALVQGETDVRGYGFMGLFRKTHVMGLFPIGSVVSIVPRI
jgi:hypothetical protein